MRWADEEPATQSGFRIGGSQQVCSCINATFLHVCAAVESVLLSVLQPSTKINLMVTRLQLLHKNILVLSRHSVVIVMHSSQNRKLQCF